MQPREWADQAENVRPTDQAEQTARDSHNSCEVEWDKLLKFWERTDEMVLRKVAQAQGDPTAQFQLDGETAKRLEDEWELLEDEEHSCRRTKCEEEFAKLLEITGRNMVKITPRDYQQEGKTSHEEERQDEAYLKWKEWNVRDEGAKADRKARIEAKERKERSWDLYRECNNILEENRNRWLERKKMEKSGRMESEQEQR